MQKAIPKSTEATSVNALPYITKVPFSITRLHKGHVHDPDPGFPVRLQAMTEALMAANFILHGCLSAACLSPQRAGSQVFGPHDQLKRGGCSNLVKVKREDREGENKNKKKEKRQPNCSSLATREGGQSFDRESLGSLSESGAAAPCLSNVTRAALTDWPFSWPPFFVSFLRLGPMTA